MKREKKTLLSRAGWLTLLFALALAALVLLGIRQAAEAQRREAKRVLEDSLYRAAVSCYAIEGRYPDTLARLTGDYGVFIDEDKYTVYYDIFASNLMPDITVLENQPDDGGKDERRP